jgi:hypothetical protein
MRFSLSVKAHSHFSFQFHFQDTKSLQTERKQFFSMFSCDRPAWVTPVSGAKVVETAYIFVLRGLKPSFLEKALNAFMFASFSREKVF